MPRKKRLPKRSVAVADFETTTRADDCRVWSWGFSYKDYPDVVETGLTIDEFIDRIQGEDLTIYFHNLRFDGVFLLDYLMKDGYTHTTERKVMPGEFSSLISDMGQFYSLKFVWHNGFSCEFRDSFKKLPFTIDRIAKAFELDTIKGEIDYHKERPIGYQPTDDEWEYQENDVKILSKAMGITTEQGMTKLTAGSDALAEFKKTIELSFDKWFPVLSQTMDSEIRSAYRGGFTYADPRFSGRLVEQCGHVYDVNSLYPYIMYDRLIPYGEPVYCATMPETSEEYPLSIFQVTFTAKLKPNHIPCIQIKNNFRFSATEYLTEISEPTTLSVTNVDWQLYNEHYDIYVLEYGPGYKFTAQTGIFKTFIDHWMSVKATSTGAMRELAKLMLNSLYGKFATRTTIQSKIPVLEENKIRLVLGDSEERDPVYTAAGVFITAYARDYTIRSAQLNYPRFAYADTDSLHLIGKESPIGLKVHKTELGAWKHEYGFTRAKWMRSKAYAEERTPELKTHPFGQFATLTLTERKLETRIAGLPLRLSAQLTLDDLTPGTVVTGKLVPKNVPGGVVLTEVDYELNF